jgi:hypothetical protein
MRCWRENAFQELLCPFYLQLVVECVNKNFNVFCYESLELYAIELPVRYTITHVLPKIRSEGGNSELVATWISGAPLLQILPRL